MLDKHNLKEEKMLDFQKYCDQGFGSHDTVEAQKIRVEMMKMRMLKEESEHQEKMMEIVAQSLASAGVEFLLKQHYTIEIVGNKPEQEELTKEAKELIDFYGKGTTIFAN